MATRLYPATGDAAHLERLAGVPAGTAGRLAKVEADGAVIEANAADRDDARFKTYCLISRDQDLDRFRAFQMWGWGRFTREAVAVLENAGQDRVCGSTNNPLLVFQIAMAQDVIPTDIVAFMGQNKIGLSWS